ncbi:MAG: anion permease [Desulfobacterales bacterium]|nr:anion permease [Desulfobacterales bacterium]
MIESSISNEMGTGKLGEFLLKNSVFSNFSRTHLAKLILQIKCHQINKDQILIQKDAAADYLFLIYSGSFKIINESNPQIIKDGFLGIETAVGLDTYKNSIIAIENSELIRISKKSINQLISSNPDALKTFFRAFHDNDDDDKKIETLIKVHKDKDTPFPYKLVIGWVSTMVLPLIMFYVANLLHFKSSVAYFLSIICLTILLWIFQLLPVFVPPLLSILLLILLNVAPPSIALSGFASGTFFMCMSVFLIGGVMISSGLTYRLMLMVLRLVPPSRFWYSFCLFIIGIILTPVVPSPTARVTMLIPFLVELMDIAKDEQDNLISTQFVLATLQGVGLVGTIFLTGDPFNLILFGMFDQQNQYTFQWLYWLYASSFAGIILLISYFILLGLFFRKAGKINISRNTINEQVKILGPLSSAEWGALMGICTLAIGIMSASIHKMDIPWLTLSIIVGLMIVGTVNADEMRSRIDWTTLIFIGTITAWVPVVSSSGLNDVITENIGWVGQYMQNNIYIFILLLFGLMMIVRIFLLPGTTAILFYTALSPIALTAGISEWFLAFIIRLISECFILPYQYTNYVLIRDDLAYRGLKYNNNRIIMFNIIMVFVRLGAIFASLPFWKYLNII